MKRYTSHYLLWSGIGYLKQFAVEMQDGYVRRIFPCTQERESVEWHPGVLLLLPEGMDFPEKNPAFFMAPVIAPEQFAETIPDDFPQKQWKAFLVYPFDFTSMQPVDETQHIPLL